MVNQTGVSAINALAFYDIHGRKKEVVFSYFVPDTTRDEIISMYFIIIYPLFIYPLMRIHNISLTSNYF
jgi:hypothetical protein